MTYRRLATATSVALGMAALDVPPAAAQKKTTDERIYCAELAKTYARYFPTRSYGSSSGASPGVETMVALELCNTDRAAEAIPEISRVLRASGFAVP